MRRRLALFALALPVAACGAPDDRQPATHDQRVATAEDRPVDVTLDAIDPDGDALTWTATAPAHGTFVIKGPLARYTPDPDFHGTDLVEVTASDGERSSAAFIVFDIAAVDDRPIARDDSFAASEDEPLSLATRAVLANDVDVDRDSLRVIGLAAISGGRVQLGDEEIVYTPAADHVGESRFTYDVTDGITVVTGVVTLRVGATNDPPITTDDVVVTDEDEPVDVTTAELLRNDRDPDGDSLGVVEVRDELGGRAVLDGTTVRFIPAADFHGDGGFAYWVSDGRAERTAWVTVAVHGQDDVPTARPLAVAGTEDQPLVIPVATLRKLARDGDGDPLVVTSVDEPYLGSVGLIGDEVRFTPAPDATGAAGFTYTVSDGTYRATARVAITLAAIDDPPLAFPQVRITRAGEAVPFTLTGRDVDSPALSFLVVEPPRHGALASLAGTGDVRYIPEPGFVGDDGLVFVAQAGGLVSAPARMTFRVEPLARCGDAVIDAGEACDDGNLVDGDGCDHVCSVSACGNGIVVAPTPTAVTLRWLGGTCADAAQPITLAIDGVIVLSTPGGDGTCGCDEPVRSIAITDPAALARFSGHAAVDLRLAGASKLAWAELAIATGGTTVDTRTLYAATPLRLGASWPTELCETATDADVAASVAWVLGEDCDDGNAVDGDGCSATCAAE